MTLKHFIYFLIGALFPLLSFAQEEEGTPNGKGGGVTFKSLRPKKKKDSITFTALDYNFGGYNPFYAKVLPEQRMGQGYVWQNAFL